MACHHLSPYPPQRFVGQQARQPVQPNLFPAPPCPPLPPGRLVSDAQLGLIVDAAWAVFDVNPNVTDSSGLGVSVFFGNGNFWTAEGAVELQELQDFLELYTHPWRQPSMALDLGHSQISSFRPCTIADIVQLQALFTQRYGYVKKPNAYEIFNGKPLPPPYLPARPPLDPEPCGPQGG